MAFITSCLLLAWPTVAVKLSKDESQTRLYFYRDRAGLNNVRLQFETMVATAAAFNKILMIPPRSAIEHVPEPFRETDLWSEKELAKVVRFEYMENDQKGQSWCPSPGAVQLLGKKGVEEIQPNELPANKDWCLGKFESRIRHFECLHMFSPDQQKVATAAVFNGLQIRQIWVQKARTYLGSLGLKPGHFVAAHLRQTDFTLAPSHFVAARLQRTDSTPCAPGLACLGSAVLERAIPTLNRYGEGRDVLIITDDPNPKFLQQLKDGAKAPTSMFFSRGQQSPSLEAAIVDMLLGAMAGTFIGTPTSTFSLSIHEMRRKMEICKKAPRITHSLGLLRRARDKSDKLAGSTPPVWTLPTSLHVLCCTMVYLLPTWLARTR